MLHWLYDPNRTLKRFVEENIKAKAEPNNHPNVMHIMHLASENGMRPSDINNLALELNPERLSMPTNEKERYSYLKYVMEILLSDLILDDAEKDLLKSLAVEIGYPVDTVSLVIRGIYDGLKNESSEKEIADSIEDALAA